MGRGVNTGALSPSWYRAEVEFQGKPESEQLDFCSRCYCTGE